MCCDKETNINQILKLPDMVQKALADVRRLFLDSVSTDSEELLDVFESVRQAPGKMLRPMFMLLFADCDGDISSRDKEAAVVIELIHTASLLHDDVIDCSSRRRSRQSLNAKLGSQNAILMGDFLVSKSLQHARQSSDDIMSRVCGVLTQMSAAELLQQANKFNFKKDDRKYLEIVIGKTASLFEAACVIGASGWQEPSSSDVPLKFAKNFGIAFQIADDYRNIFCDQQEDTALSDIKEGNFTLPVIHALESRWRSELVSCIEEAYYDKIPQILRSSGSDKFTISAIDDYKTKALGWLTQLPQSQARNALIENTKAALVI